MGNQDWVHKDQRIYAPAGLGPQPNPSEYDYIGVETRWGRVWTVWESKHKRGKTPAPRHEEPREPRRNPAVERFKRQTPERILEMDQNIKIAERRSAEFDERHLRHGMVMTEDETE